MAGCSPCVPTREPRCHGPLGTVSGKCPPRGHSSQEPCTHGPPEARPSGSRARGPSRLRPRPAFSWTARSLGRTGSSEPNGTASDRLALLPSVPQLACTRLCAFPVHETEHPVQTGGREYTWRQRHAGTLLRRTHTSHPDTSLRLPKTNSEQEGTNLPRHRSIGRRGGTERPAPERLQMRTPGRSS